MNYELCKKLKDAGFPQTTAFYIYEDGAKGLIPEFDNAAIPTLSELIEALGSKFISLQAKVGGYSAFGWTTSEELDTEFGYGKTPEIAVAKLWLELNK